MIKNESNIVIDEKKLNGWTVEHEQVFIEWSDKAMCYRWLHSKSYKNFSFRNAWFTIPVIIMSTITGTANFAQERIPPKSKFLAQMIIGAINIFAGILTTIQQFLKISELRESHRVSAISWGKFVRNITVTLAKSPLERESTPIDLLNQYKEEFDRLMEISPDIEDKVLKKFKLVIYNKEKDDKDGCLDKITECCLKMFCCQYKELIDENNNNMNNINNLQILDTPNTKTSESSFVDEVTKEAKKKYKFKKPEIFGEFVSVSENRHPWFKQEKIVEKKEIELKEEKINYDIYINIINEKIKRFIEIKGREPLKLELINNINNEIPIDIVNLIFEDYYNRLNLNKA
jgi:hypothetical protein